LIEAAKYYKLSADQGNPFGQYNYGFCLTNGAGVERNLMEAAKYYKLSADQGNP
jgi:TPR repeat protein